MRLRIKPVALGAGFLFVLALWLADINILIITDKGFSAEAHVTANTQFPAIILLLLAYSAMAASMIYFSIEIKKKRNVNTLFSGVFLISALFGLFLFLLGSAGLIFMGHISYIFGVSSLAIYHSSLPLLVLSTIGLMIIE